MMRLVLVFLTLLFPTMLLGQSFTQKLQQKKAGQGVVVIYQDQAIDDLVNGKSSIAVPAKREPVASQIVRTTVAGGDSTVTGKTYRNSYSVTGYRIQLYIGDSSRNARQKAHSAGTRFKSFFPTVPVYTHFYSPHWICRVGDFRTYEEAEAKLHELRGTGEFREAAIIKCKIQVGK